MKKISLMMLAVLGLGFASCDDNKYPEPQKNPQLPMVVAGDVVVEAAVPEAIDLVALNADNTPVALGKVASVTNLPEGYDVFFVGQLGREADFKHVADFEITVDPETKELYAAPDALEAAYVAAIGKSSKTKEVYIRVAGYAKREATDDNGEAVVRLGGLNTYYIETTSAITPLDLGIVIESGYGLLGTINGWSVADAVPFNHSGEDVYDDPIFTLVVSISAADAEGGWWWKVVPQSTIDAGNWQDVDNGSFGVAENGDSALEGNLVPRTATTDCGAGCIKTAGVYILTLDMENQTYEYVPVYTSYLYTPGTYNGWSQPASNPLVSIDDVKYYGFAMFDGEFKFCGSLDWSGPIYGASGTEGLLASPGDNLNYPYGPYYCTVNTQDLSYKLTEITSVGVIGEHNGWSDGEPELFMISDLVYVGDIALSGEFKFRFNGSWDINLGGTPSLLEPNGANLKVPAGYYTITLDLSQLPYKCTIVEAGEQQD